MEIVKLKKVILKSVHQACTVQNNKGMTLVELIITFSILLVIVIGMFNLILDLNLNLDDQKIIKDYTEYSNFVNNDLQQSLIKKKPVAIAIIKDLSGQKECIYNSSYSSLYNECTIGDDNVFKVALSEEQPENPSENQNEDSNENEDMLPYMYPIQGSLSISSSNICAGYYPCAVYAYYDDDTEQVEFDAIALSVSSSSQYGIMYTTNKGNNNWKKKFEPVPDPKYVNKSKMALSRMSFDDGTFVINFYLHINDAAKNYGFKIAYPLSKLSR